MPPVKKVAENSRYPTTTRAGLDATRTTAELTARQRVRAAVAITGRRIEISMGNKRSLKTAATAKPRQSEVRFADASVGMQCA